MKTLKYMLVLLALLFLVIQAQATVIIECWVSPFTVTSDLKIYRTDGVLSSEYYAQYNYVNTSGGAVWNNYFNTYYHGSWSYGYNQDPQPISLVSGTAHYDLSTDEYWVKTVDRAGGLRTRISGTTTNSFGVYQTVFDGEYWDPESFTTILLVQLGMINVSNFAPGTFNTLYHQLTPTNPAYDASYWNAMGKIMYQNGQAQSNLMYYYQNGFERYRTTIP